MLRTLVRRAALLAVPAFLMAPVVVVAGPAGQAAAAVTTTTAATIAARAAAPGVATVCAGGGPVTWTICGIGAAALLGAGLYYTRDTWLPWLGLGGGASNGPGAGTVQTVVLEFTPPPTFDAATSSWAMDVTATNTQPTVAVTAYYTLAVTCVSGSGVYATYTTGVTWSSLRQTTPQEKNFILCGPSQSPAVVTLSPTAACDRCANSLNWAGAGGVTRAPESATDQQKADAAANAARMQFRTELTCKSGSTTQVLVVESAGAPVMPSCADRLGAGWEPTRSDTWGGFDRNNIKATPPQTLTNQRDTLYPDCAVSSCTMYVEHRGTRCVEGATGCVRWSEGVIANPADYKCRYGPYTLTVDACNPLERLYEPGGSTIPATGPNVDGQPSTWTPPGTSPSTGTPVITRPETNPGTGTQPGPGTSPSTGGGGTGGGPVTITDPVTIGGGTLDRVRDTEGFDCFDGVWSFDPVDWVIVPGKCLWVPQTDLVGVHNEISALAETKFPFDVVIAITDNFDNTIAGANCPDWRIRVPGFDKNVVCDSGFTDALRSARPVLAGFLILLATLPFVRSVLYAWMPVIKPQPLR